MWLGAAALATPRAEPGAAKTVPFVFNDLDGQPVRLTDFRGKWVLVNFWAHWCPLCWVEVPALNQLNSRDDAVVIGVGMDYGGDLGKVRDAVARHDLQFHRIVAGGARRDPLSPHHQVGPVDFFPTSYLYDPSGELSMFLPGQVRLEKVLAVMAAWGGRSMPTRQAVAMNLAPLETSLRQRHGESGKQAFIAWRETLERLAHVPVAAQLEGVNNFFNKRIRGDTDQNIWKRQDYWATPGETLGMGRGDSEDLAIAKYFSLIALGMPAERLRLTYAKPLANKGDGGVMVLAYYATPEAEPMVLDQRNPKVLPASARSDLKPVFSFNSRSLWGVPGAEGNQLGSGERLPVWQDLLRRAKEEGFE